MSLQQRVRGVLSSVLQTQMLLTQTAQLLFDGTSATGGIMPGHSPEYDRLLAQLQDEHSGLTDDEMLANTRRLTQLAPNDLDAWWSVASQTDWMLRAFEGPALASNPLFTEMLDAYDHVTALNPTDSAGPYNKARNFWRAGMLGEAYGAYMQAGRTEVAHPGDIDWPAAWNFKRAADLALQLGRPDDALAAAQEALDLCGADDPDARDAMRMVRAWLDDE